MDFPQAIRLLWNDWSWDYLFVRSYRMSLKYLSLTLSRYFSTVFAATSTFPRYNGIASGTSMALFGSSPLVITMLATRYFGTGETSVDVTRFLKFLAVLTATTHVFGTLALRVPSEQPVVSPDEPIIIVTDADEENDVYTTRDSSLTQDPEDETTALLTPKKTTPSTVQIFPVQEPRHESTLELLQDGYFWIFAFIITVVVGSVRTVYSVYLPYSSLVCLERNDYGQPSICIPFPSPQHPHKFIHDRSPDSTSCHR
jgi:hypothetical protein